MKSAAEKAEIALRMVRELDDLVYDTETSGLDWKRNFPVGYVIGDTKGTSLYVPVRHGGGGNLPDPNVRTPEVNDEPYNIHSFEKELARAFADRQRLKPFGNTIGHNIKFDCHASANAGIMLGRNLVCTQNTAALLDEYARSFSLDACAQRHGVTAKKGDLMYQHIADVCGVAANKDAMGLYWKLSGDDPMVVEYAEGDGITTGELYLKQLEQVIEQHLSVVYDLEQRLIWTCFRMERRGMKVDTSYLDELVEVLSDKVREAESKLPDGFNPRSPKAVKEWAEKAGRTDWPLTEKGNPSFTESWLSTFPEGRILVDVRKYTHLVNSFIQPLMDDHLFNGRVHPTLNQLKSDDKGTISGRFSCSNPNMQQIPKHDKELAKLFRRAFVADDGMEFYEGDYSQCEPRLFAHYSQDANLLEGYRSTPPKDVHTIVAEMFQVDRGTTGKRMNMGMFTGMFHKSFAGHMDWTLEHAKEMWDKWFELFPGVAKFQEQAKDVIKQRGFVKTLLGRRGRLEAPRFAYRATSKIIQGGNADIVKHKLLRIDEELERGGDVAHLLMTVHDSFVWQSPDSDEGRNISSWITEEMADVQSEPFNLRVPFLVDMGKGRNWSEATFGE